MEREERIDIYTIPPNFAEEGTLFSGRVKTRNAIETAGILMVLVPVLLSLETTAKIKMYIGMIVLVPVVILSVIGIQGESLMAFIGSFFQYVKRRRHLTPPDERYRLEQNRRKKRLQKRERSGYGEKGSRGKEETKRRKQERTGEPTTAMEAGTAAGKMGCKARTEKTGGKTGKHIGKENKKQAVPKRKHTRKGKSV